MKSLDVAHINPFLQSSISVIEMTTQVKLAVGKPGLSELNFPGKAFLLQVGVTGELKGQVLMAMSEESARFFAEKMMMGMQIDELNDMAVSALCELSNMVMGNTGYDICFKRCFYGYYTADCNQRRKSDYAF